jgi:hypothetical protein
MEAEVRRARLAVFDEIDHDGVVLNVFRTNRTTKAYLFLTTPHTPQAI